MTSRTSITQQLMELQRFKFVSYYSKIDSSSHLVRLRVVDFEGCVIAPELLQPLFIVTEQAGFLSAVSVDKSLHIERLS